MGGRTVRGKVFSIGFSLLLLMAGWAGLALADPVGLNPTGDAEGSTLAVSGTGNAQCTSYLCVAASGSGDASGRVAASGAGPSSGGVAVSGTGDARATSIGVSGTGKSEGHTTFEALPSEGSPARLNGLPIVNASPDGDAEGWVALSGTGQARGIVAVSLGGYADGAVAVSGKGNASGVVAVSGTRNATGGVAVSGMGNASGVIATSAIGNADGLVAVAGNHSRGTYAAVGGDSADVDGYAGAAMGLGDTTCGRSYSYGCVGASATGNASCRALTRCAATTRAGDAEATCNWYSGPCTAVSGSRSAEGGIALGGGDAWGRLAAASIHGTASGNWVAVGVEGDARYGFVTVSVLGNATGHLVTASVGGDAGDGPSP